MEIEENKIRKEGQQPENVNLGLSEFVNIIKKAEQEKLLPGLLEFIENYGRQHPEANLKIPEGMLENFQGRVGWGGFCGTVTHPAITPAIGVKLTKILTGSRVRMNFRVTGGTSRCYLVVTGAEIYNVKRGSSVSVSGLWDDSSAPTIYFSSVPSNWIAGDDLEIEVTFTAEAYRICNACSVSGTASATGILT